MSAATYYPPPAFRFAASVVSGSGDYKNAAIDGSFRDISGIDAKFESEDVQEGGENRFTLRLPKPPKYPPLVMTRGFVWKESPLAMWVEETLYSNFSTPISTRHLLVSLLGPTVDPLATWLFSNAYPIRWTIGKLNSMENAVLTETLEFSYNYLLRTT